MDIGEQAGREQHGNQRLLSVANLVGSIEGQGGDDVIRVEPQRSLQDVAVEPLKGLTLQVTRQVGTDGLARGIVGIFATQIALHVVDIPLILCTAGTVHRVHVVVLTIGLTRPLHQVLQENIYYHSNMYNY